MRNFVKRHKAVLTLIPVVAVMIMIFCFSAQDAEESGKTSNIIVDKVIELVEPEYEKLPSEEQTAILNKVTFSVRKAGHFSEFAMLGFFVLLHLSQWKKRLPLYALWAEIFCVIYAVTDEVHQFMSPGRGPAVTDVLIDGFGSLFGVLSAFLILLYMKRRKTGEKHR